MKLCADKESPFCHGFTLEHSALIRARCLSQEVVDTINDAFNDSGFPTQEEVWGETLGEGEVIEPNTCLPRAGRPPPASSLAPPKKDKFKLLAEAITNRNSPQEAPVIQGGLVGPRFFQFKQGGTAEVCIEADSVKTCVLTLNKSTFTGKDIWDLVKAKDKNSVFKVTKEEKAKLNQNAAGVVLTLTQHDNLQLTCPEFESEEEAQLLKHFVGEVKGLDIDSVVVDFELEDEDLCKMQ